MRGVIFFVFILTVLCKSAVSQTSTCFEIESILVDACAPSGGEGQNEMVRFLVGPNPLNTSDLNVVWATTANSWDGVCQDASTAQKVIQLNATIQSCGFLKEPTAGVLPANSKVLLISGFNMDVTANSFAGLSDTLYIIFHCSTSPTGNFANSGMGIRTLSMTFNAPAGCSDQVSYDRSLLVNTAGLPGSADGATANFAFDGNVTYSNDGCTAPFLEANATWTSPGSVCNTASPIDLNTLVTGTTGGTWSGTGVTTGIFDPTALSGSYDITYAVGGGSCISISTQTIIVTAAGVASFTNPGTVCSSSPVIELNNLLTGITGGTWSGSGVSGTQFNPSGLSGSVVITYAVGSGTCASQAQQTAIIIPSPVPPIITGQTIYCSGEIPVQLSASGASGATFNWYADAALTQMLSTNSTFTPTAGLNASFYVTQQVGACAGNPAIVNVVFNEQPEVPTFISPVVFCLGAALPVLTATSAFQIDWFSDAALTNEVATGASFQPISNSQLSYWLTATNGTCISAAVELSLDPQQPVEASIQVNGPSVLCGPGFIELISSSSTGNVWSTLETSSSIQVSTAGTYSLVITGACNTDEAVYTLIDASVTASFTASPQSGSEPLSVIFEDQSQQADQCNWFIDGSPASISSGNATIFSLGNYTVTLICSNASGCADTLSRTIEVISDKIEVLIPNSFTPNGDGMNDQFKIKTLGITELNAVLFNRWGNKVYEWEGVASGWDGTSSAGNSPDGVYFYIIQVKDALMQEKEFKGSVTLIR